MSDKKGLGSKILGVFVESDGDPTGAEGAEKTPAEIVAELARSGGGAKGSKPDAGPPPNLKLDQVTAAPGAEAPSDFGEIFRQAGMDAGELDRVKKAEDLLKSLPDATPQAVKKQIVEASLKAFGFDVAKIVEAAENQKRALDAYVRVNENATAKALTDAQAEIQKHTEKIAALQKDMEKRRSTLTAVSVAATKRKADVQKVLEFFQAAGVVPGSVSGEKPQ